MHVSFFEHFTNEHVLTINTICIPRAGEIARLNNTDYKITSVYWFIREETQAVSIVVMEI